MNREVYLRRILNSFLNKEYKNNVMVIKHYNSFSMSKEEIKESISDDKTEVIYHKYKRDMIPNPYEPFLDIIRDYYKKYYEKDIELIDFLHKCGVYLLHESIFESYFNTGECKRDEQIIVSEVKYEKKMFHKDIVGCLKYIAKEHDMLIVLDYFQNVSYTIINFILQIIEDIDSIAIRLLIIYNELQQVSSYKVDMYGELVNKFVELNMHYEWESSTSFRDKDYHARFTPENAELEGYYRAIANLNSYLNLFDAEYYLKKINDRIAGEKLEIDKFSRIRFYLQRAYNFLLSNDAKSALFMCESAISYAKINDENVEIEDLETIKIQYHTCFMTSLAQLHMTQSQLADKYADICVNIAKKLDDEELLFNAEVLKNYIMFEGWRDVFLVDFKKVSYDYEFMRKLKAKKYYNTLAYYYSYGADNDAESIELVAAGEKRGAYAQARELADILGNKNLMLSVYTKNIILFTDNGCHKFVNYFYDEKYRLLELENDTRRMANLMLGRGYNAIVSEKPFDARDFFKKGIEILYQRKQAEAIAEAMYNLAVNCMCCSDYGNAYFYLTSIFTMLNNLGLETILICNTSKIYGLLGICDYVMGNEYKAYLCMGKMEILLSHIINSRDTEAISHWEEDLFLYNFIGALLEMTDGKIDETRELMMNARFYYEAYTGSRFCNVVFFTQKWHEFFTSIGEMDVAMEMVENSLKYCYDNGFKEKAHNIERIMVGKQIESTVVPCDFGGITMDMIIELSYNVGKHIELDDRKKDIGFLSSWQEMINREEYTEDDIIKNGMVVIQNNFNFDNILFLSQDENNEIHVLYKDSKLEIKGDEAAIFDFFSKSKTEFLISRVSKSFSEYEEILNIFDMSQIVTMIGVPVISQNRVEGAFIGLVNMHRNFRRNRVLLKEDNLIILKSAVIQLVNKLEQIKNIHGIEEANEKLSTLAVTDNLTGLYNRQGFDKRIHDTVEGDNTLSILYVDLDNFKYYNDTFGHEIGDLILAEFAKIFRKASKDNGYAVRYGGDEFLIVLNNVNEEKVLSVVDDIYNSISDGFKDKISEYKGGEITIPDEKKVSCSIGIASSDNNEARDIKTVLQRADEAMYVMKKGNKGGYVIWNNSL